MFDQVSCVIPGASRAEHVEANVQASGWPALTGQQMAGVQAIYEKYIKDPVHHLW